MDTDRGPFIPTVLPSEPSEPTNPISYIPILISPKEGAVLDNGRIDFKDYKIWNFDWSDVSEATKYNLYVIGSGAKYPAISREVFSSFYQEKKYASYVANKNRFDWKWKVRAFAYGSWRSWSEERSFEVEPVDTDPPTDE